MKPDRSPDRMLQRVAAVVLAASLAAFGYIVYNSLPCFFDDAYMFVRYANNLLAGYGHAWNPGGEQTFGSTSLPHVAVVTALKAALPDLSDARLLLVASAIPGFVLLAVLVIGCGRLAKHPLLHRNYVLWGAILVPAVVFQEPFKYHLRSGMDTMLSALGNAVLIFATMWLVARPKAARLAVVVAAAYLTYLIRPDNGIYATLFPALAILLLAPRPRLKPLAAFTAGMLTLLLLDLAAKRLLLGTALPLPFYAKQHGVYEGYLGTSTWNPVVLMRIFFWTAMPWVCVIVLLFQHRLMRLLAAFFVPVALTFAYYFTVNQIMGFEARFYYPSIPFFVIAAAVALDAWLLARLEPESPGEPARPAIPSAGELVLRLVVLSAVVFGGRQVTYTTYLWYDRLMAETAFHPSRQYETAAQAPLPPPAAEDAIFIIGSIADKAPPGTRVALTEYGIVGAAAPDAVLIDMVGLHDKEFALCGFSAERLFARKPDLIWMPHSDYTKMISEILDSDEFWEHYRYYPSAFILGLAIRTDGEHSDEIEALVEAEWKRNYGDLEMKDYLAHPLPPNKTEPPGESERKASAEE